MKAPATDGDSRAVCDPALADRPRQAHPKPGPRAKTAAFSLVRRGRWPAFAVFAEEGPHTLEIATLEGVCVLRASGTGPEAYSLSGLPLRTVYTISGSTGSGGFSRRLLIP